MEKYIGRKFILTVIAMGLTFLLAWFGRLTVIWGSCIVGILGTYTIANIIRHKQNGGEK